MDGTQTTLVLSNRDRGLLLGHERSAGQPLRLSRRLLEQYPHLLAVGATRRGKSKFLELLCRQWLASSHGFCLVDPHGDLYQEVLQQAWHRAAEERLVLIDTTDPDYVVGLNPLEALPGLDPAKQVDYALQAILLAFGERDLSEKPQIQRWLPAALRALAEAGGTLVELRQFLGDPGFRAAVLERVRSGWVRDEWRFFEESAKSAREKAELLQGVYNRVMPFIQSDYLRAVLGQRHSTVNFRQAMDAGKIVLVNVARGDERSRRLLGALVINQVVQAAHSREDVPRAERPLFGLFVDECSQYVTNDIARVLRELGKFGIFSVLAMQDIAELKTTNVGLYAALQNNTNMKAVFGLNSREDLEVMADTIGSFTGREVKLALDRQIVTPVETTREVFSETEALAEAESESHVQSWGRSSARTWSEGMAESEFSGTSLLYEQGESDLGWSESGRVSHSAGKGRTRQSSYGASDAWSEGGASGQARSRVRSRSRGRAVVPFIEPQVGRELASVQFVSPEEERERLIERLRKQPPRQFLFQLGPYDAVACQVPALTPALPLSERELARLRERVYVRGRTARRRDEVVAALEEGRQSAQNGKTAKPRPRTSQELFGVEE